MPLKVELAQRVYAPMSGKLRKSPTHSSGSLAFFRIWSSPSQVGPHTLVKNSIGFTGAWQGKTVKTEL